jgi:CheY-like chemotaxis protein
MEREDSLRVDAVVRGPRVRGGAMTERGLCPQSESKARSAVLIVEDEVLVRMLLAEQLRQAGYPVIEAANAHEAVEVLRHSSDVKLVVSDIRMPGSMDGVELARLVKSEYPNVKVMLASGHLSAIDWVTHDGYFRKPYEFRKIIEHIRMLMD